MPTPEKPKLVIIKGGNRHVPLSYHPKRQPDSYDLRAKFLESQDRALRKAMDSYEAAQSSPKQEN